MNRHLLIFLDKTIFRILFLLVVLVSRFSIRKGKGVPTHLEGNERILVIRPGGLGDGIMAIPLLKCIKEHAPRCRVTLLCQRKTRLAFDHVRYYDELVVIDDIDSIRQNIRFLASTRFHAVLDLEPFRRMSSIIAFLVGKEIRAGFDTNNRRLLYTHIISYPNEKNFESINMVRQLEVFGILPDRERASDIRFPLPIGLEDRALATLSGLSVDPDRNFIVAVFPGVLKPHHRWKMEEYAVLIRLILEEDERVVVLLMGTPGDRKDVDEVLQVTGENGRVKDLAGLTNFGESMGILKATRILVSCDGGAVYMGASMGCATLSIWGPGVLERFKPPGPMHVGVRKEYPCIPCVNYSRLGEFPKCPYDRKCLNTMAASEVFQHYMILKAGIPVGDRGDA